MRHATATWEFLAEQAAFTYLERCLYLVEQGHMPIAVDDAEIQMESLLRKGALDRVAVLALETYGAELFAFLIKVSGSESDAREIFSQLVEDMWRGLPMFEFRCSIRSWLYTLARHAYARFRRSPWNQAARRGLTWPGLVRLLKSAPTPTNRQPRRA